MPQVYLGQAGAVLEHVSHACHLVSLEAAQVDVSQAGAAVEHSGHIFHVSSAERVAQLEVSQA